jgi:5-methyltetrahydropteroyltriglutamate--homocysteine methyltransferase
MLDDIMTIHTHIPGFPRIGAARELALERHWRGDQTRQPKRRPRHCARATGRCSATPGLDRGDFYDQVANHIQLLGCERRATL